MALRPAYPHPYLPHPTDSPSRQQPPSHYPYPVHPWCSTYNFLWSFVAYRLAFMIGICNNFRSGCRFTTRWSLALARARVHTSTRQEGLHFPDIISDYGASRRHRRRRAIRYEDPIMESQRFSSYLERSLCISVDTVGQGKEWQLAAVSLPSPLSRAPLTHGIDDKWRCSRRAL